MISPICEHGSVLDWSFTKREVLGSIPGQGICSHFSYATTKMGRQLEVSAKSSYSNNLVKIRVVLGVFRHAESKSSLYFVLSLLQKEVLVILC